MRCPGRSGWGEASTASDRGGGKPRVGESLRRPLAREISVGCASKHGHPRSVSCTSVRGMKKAARVGDHGRGGRGLDDYAVVLVGRYGCRNRQAARGPRRPWVNSPWCCLGSSPPTRERQGANKCRKPESWWQNREIGGGFPFNGSAKADPGSTCRWKALCVADVAPFDEGATESALAPRVLWVTRAPRRDRERQRSVPSLARG
jgi:hypothetical protein